MIQTDKKIIYFDLETTGIDIAKDRIVQFAMFSEKQNLPSIAIGKHEFICNPGIPIPKEASDVHGITDEMVADKPPFSHFAARIVEEMKGSVLVGYNLINFDVPLLAEELLRAGYQMPSCPIIDAGNLFKKKEERTLSAAMQFYCGKELDGAHDAMNDVMATRSVLHAQLERYQDVPRTVEELEIFTRFGEPRLDFAGKFAKDADGDYCYNFGKNKGQKIKHDTGFLRWMFGKDFTRDTLAWAEKIYDEVTAGQTFP